MEANLCRIVDEIIVSSVVHMPEFFAVAVDIVAAGIDLSFWIAFVPPS